MLLNYYRSGRALPFHSKSPFAGLIAIVSAASMWYITVLGDPGFGQTTIAVIAGPVFGGSGGVPSV